MKTTALQVRLGAYWSSTFLFCAQKLWLNELIGSFRWSVFSNYWNAIVPNSNLCVYLLSVVKPRLNANSIEKANFLKRWKTRVIKYWLFEKEARVGTNQVKQNPSVPFVSFLVSPWRRANARIVSFQILYCGQFPLSTQLILPNYPVILSHRRSTTFSLETYSLSTSKSVENIYEPVFLTILRL